MGPVMNFSSHKTHLILTALATSVLTASLLTAYNSYRKQRARRILDEEVRRSLATHEPKEDISLKASGGTLPEPRQGEDWSVLNGSTDFDDELVREQLARNYAFFGEEGMAKIRGGSVVIIGCGGVGSWAAVMLARSGVSKIRLVDFDYVTLSSLNRHATATLADVGTPKVKCIERTLKQVCKWINIEACVDIWKKEEGGRLLEDVDWVVDAIDNITTKVDLLHYCHSNNIKVFSSMGAGAKSDPTRIQISDISYTIYDPLARSVRRRLRVLGINSGIPVVYSTEVPGDVKLLPLPEEEFQKGNVNELNVFDDFRVRILPVIGPLPSIFGLHIATYIICNLAGKPIANPLPIKNRRKLYERLSRELLTRESRIAGEQLNRIPIDEDDVALIFEDVYLGRSLIPPHPVPTKAVLVRWDPNEPVTLENVVVMEGKEADHHMRECWDLQRRPGEVWGEHVEGIVRRRAEEVRRVREAVL
ncbi:ubiquitin-protein ligase molybdopterin-converting factor [Neolentinus lepideus HHB14362 ss-1]|uniref:Ubiquitin-protein ligase molybdopterin-converting factor n=1 Tax=Neolentinus lepideus HHB14362 ss-1 TaxID=1314782 RepID=A0A165T5H7_9AGAM|nr:ubiquitin-protein ligase molybdopterin-converting factor [Neolentinus lepideus HHB14362 ss-1]